jgi:mRNA interferase MazF
LKRGELYRVYKGAKRDPKNHRVFVVVSRQALIDTTFSSVVCAPVYSNYEGAATQIPVGINEGLKHDSAIYCDELMSLSKTQLTDYVGKLGMEKLVALKGSLLAALELQEIE